MTSENPNSQALTSPQITSTAAFLFIFGLCLFLRFFVIGQPPFTDEGVYLLPAWCLAHGISECFANTPFRAYSLLATPLVHLTQNLFFSARCLDAILCASFCGSLYLLLRSLGTTGKAFLVALLFTLTFNSPLFINAGFRNPVTPAFLLFTTSCLALLRRHPSKNALILGGIAAAGAIILREQFAGLVVLLALWLLLNRGAVRFGIFTAITAATFIFGCLAILGLLGHLDHPLRYALNFYDSQVILYQGLNRDVDLRERLILHFNYFWDVAGPFLLLAVISALFLLSKKSARDDRVILYLNFSILPVCEFLLKAGQSYHLSMSLFGLALLANAGLNAADFTRRELKLLTSFLCLLTVFLCPSSIRGNQNLLQGGLSFWVTAHSDSKLFWPVMVNQEWREDLAPISFYLDTAYKIIKHSSVGDRIAVSGFTAGLLPLSQRLPHQTGLVELTTASYAPSDPEAWPKVRWEFNHDPPEIFVETDAYPQKDTKKIFDNFELRYKLVAEVGHAARHYGKLGCKIWRLKKRFRRVARPD